MNQVLLKVNGLSKTFDIGKGIRSKNQLIAVDDVSFEVHAGQTLGIVGESGCGKSTLGNTIMRLYEPTAGQIFFDGQDITHMKEHQLKPLRADFQMIFQDPKSSLNPRMRVFDIIAEPLRTHKKLTKDQLTKEIHQLMNDVGLDPVYQDRFPHEFSGGQRQRIGIARALALKPKLMILDEPVSALDVSIQAQILNLLIELQKKYEMSYVFIAHGLPAVQYISDRIAVMYLGSMVELAPKDILFKEPMHPYTKGLMNSLPVSHPIERKEDAVILQGDMPSPVDPPKGCKFHTRCPFATNLCEEKRPQLQELKSNHFVACHHPLVENQ